MGKEARRGSAASSSNDAIIDKRVLQNRLAQRAFRERKENRIKDLETQVALLQSQLTEATEKTIRRSLVRILRTPEGDDNDLDATGEADIISDNKMAVRPTAKFTSYTQPQSQQSCSTCENERQTSAAMAAQLQHLEARVAEIQSHNETLQTLMVNYRYRFLVNFRSQQFHLFQPIQPVPGSQVVGTCALLPNLPSSQHLITTSLHVPWNGLQPQPSDHSNHPPLSSSAELHSLLLPFDIVPMLPLPPDFYLPQPDDVGSLVNSSSSSMDLRNLYTLDVLSQDSFTGTRSGGGSLGSGNSSVPSAASSMCASKASRALAGHEIALRRVDASGTANASTARSLDFFTSGSALASSMSSTSSLAARKRNSRDVNQAGGSGVGVALSTARSHMPQQKMSGAPPVSMLSVHDIVNSGGRETVSAAGLKFGPTEQEFCHNALRRLPSLKDLPAVDLIMDAYSELGRAVDEMQIKQRLVSIFVCKHKILDVCNEIDRLQAIEIFSITHSTDAETAAVASLPNNPNFSNSTSSGKSDEGVSLRSTAAIISAAPASLTSSDPGIFSAALFRDAIRFVPSLQGADNLLDELIDVFWQQRSCMDPIERKDFFFHMLEVRGKLANMCAPEDKSKFMYALELARQANKGQVGDLCKAVERALTNECH